MVPVVVVRAAESSDCEVDAEPSATVAGLLAALGEPGPLMVDGSPMPPDRLLDDVLVAGAVLTTGTVPAALAAPEGDAGQHHRFRFQVLAGPGAGMAVGLAPGRHVVGSGERADIRLRTPGVAPHHAVLEVGASVRLVDAAGVRPLDAGTVLVIGNTLACVAPAPDPGRTPRLTSGGTIPLNRRPRLSPLPPDPAIALPDPPPAEPSQRAMGWASLVVPVLFGLTMAVLVDPRMALFALLGPLMMVGGRVDDRRLRRRARRLVAARIGADAAALAATLNRRRTRDLRRRRADQPSVATLAWWVERGSPRVWERRRGDRDLLQLQVGFGTVRWAPGLAGDPEAAGAPISDVLAANGVIPSAPVTVDLGPRRVLGLAGDRATALDLGRGLLCSAAVLHGPSDLRLAVVTDRPEDWDWAKWLPHTLVMGADRRRLLAGDAAEAAAVLELIGAGLGGEHHRPAVLVVVDRGPLSDPVGLLLRRLLTGGETGVAGVVLAESEDDLPAECTGVVRCAPHRATVAIGGEPVAVDVAGAVESVAAAIARSLARYHDPDQMEAGAGLPRTIRLLDLVGISDPSPDVLVERWAERGDALDAVVGVTGAELLHIDLVADGPHALVAGTTGSGKSELLRTLVASLALAHDPDHLTFVLVDYKGGSAFDAAATLPHAVGLVTDLDGGLAERALRCLEAELRHRERELRTLGAPDLPAFRRLGGRMPRMVIVVDEFAALARELPRFVESLVDIAARGRSLGIHLVLATQRPAGVVGDAIRANTNVRIALRVTDRVDSVDVIGDPSAAAIGRRQPGRGVVRRGPGELVAFQAAIVSTTGATTAAEVMVRPFRFAHTPGDDPGAPAPAALDVEPTDLARIAAAATAAAARMGLDHPRRPWPEPLPDRVTTDDIPAAAGAEDGVVVGLADEPDRQRTVAFTWSPLDGPLGLYGAPGSGLTTTLEAVVLGLVAGHASTPTHIYVVDVGGGLAALARLAPVGAVVSMTQGDRIARLVRMLLADIDRRRTPGRGPRGPGTVLVVDGLEALLRSLDGADTAPVRDGLLKVIAEGPGAGIVTVFATSRPAGLPAPVEAAVAERLVLRQSDPMGAAVLGVRGADGLARGRAVHSGSGRAVQLAVPGPALVAAAELAGAGPQRPPPVGVLPDVVCSVEVEELVDTRSDRWVLPVGIGDRSLAPVGFVLGPGDHVLVVGGAGSGKTTLLAAVAAVVCRRAPIHGPEGGAMRVVAIGPALAGSLPHAVEHVAATELAGVAAELLGGDDRALLLVDDGDDLAGTGVAELVASRRPRLHVVATARPAIKAAHGHWVLTIATSRLGIWLRPSTGVDADLWRTPLPRRLPIGPPAGRGLLIADGATELVQVMRP